MAHKVEEFVRAIAGGGAYPNGDTQDNPGGTLVNRLAMTDLWQTMQQIMIQGNIAPNGLDDNGSNIIVRPLISS